MPVDQDYVKAMETWSKSMRLIIDDSNDTIADCKRVIELNQKRITLEQELVDYNRERLDKGMEKLAEHLKEGE